MGWTIALLLVFAAGLAAAVCAELEKEKRAAKGIQGAAGPAGRRCRRSHAAAGVSVRHSATAICRNFEKTANRSVRNRAEISVGEPRPGFRPIVRGGSRPLAFRPQSVELPCYDGRRAVDPKRYPSPLSHDGAQSRRPARVDGLSDSVSKWILNDMGLTKIHVHICRSSMR